MIPLNSNKYNNRDWINKRNSIIERDGGKCIKCGSNSDLRVHHLKYSDNNVLWNVEDKYLETLCDTCHKKTHSLVSIEIKYMEYQRLFEKIYKNSTVKNKTELLSDFKRLIKKYLVRL